MKKILFILLLTFLFVLVSAQEKETLIGVEINFNGEKISIENIYFDYGYKTENNAEGIYVLKLFDKNGNILEGLLFNFPKISFSADSSWFDERREQTTIPDLPQTMLSKTLHLPYHENIGSVSIFDIAGNELLNIQVADFSLYCGDNFCQSSEDYDECPEDCGGSLDGICDGIKDIACDPDCTPEQDADCGKNPSNEIFVWKNAYGEIITKAQIEMITKMSVENREVSSASKIFEIFDRDILNNDKIRTIENSNAIKGHIDSEKNELIANWKITDEDYNLANDAFENFKGFYFSVGKIKSSNLEIIPANIDANSCSDYNKDYCESCFDSGCDVAENTLNPLFETLEINAFCGEKYGDSDYTTDCFCKWDVKNNKCDAGFRFIPSEGKEKIGECVLSISSDDCADKFFEFSWNAKWNWHNDGETDSLNVNAKCSNGKKTLPCPAQIQLPFFGLWQFVFSLLGIWAIYFCKKNLKFYKKLKDKK
jgi:hypothetical protein